MRKCCCCNVKTGAVILGLLNFIVPLLIIVPLAGYWSGTDIDGLDVLRDNQKVLEKVFEDSLKSHSWTADSAGEIMYNLRAWFFNLVVLGTAYAGVTALFSFFVVLGVCCEARCMMVPFLILTMVDIILAGAVGIVVVVALFYLNTIPGVVSAVVYVMVAVVSLYSWATVLAAYKQLGKETEYVYSPVTQGKNNHHPEYYPSAPQHFVLEEYRDLKTDRQ
eukprot:TRINITY_DN4626_c0_g1_i2.p1 TRINITY_DN4626_c0_g1~~TRINITY_DN4626_c0_g1_i2.p1  ORF type:complete len:220 (-),score=63.46 TRINITY_DN4626_c0_g1_i2:294-953(-)